MEEINIIKKLKKLLGSPRFNHTIRVRDKAVFLARIHGVDIKKARLAALLHDCSRYLDRQGFIEKAKEIKMPIDAFSRIEPKLLHAPLSAYIAKNEFGIKDEQVLKAIRLHTLGSSNMSTLDKIIYVADHAEVGRRHKSTKKIRELAKLDLDMAVVAVSESMIKYLSGKGLPVHPSAFKVRDRYKIKHDKKKSTASANKTK
jgi:predicted HD superfamily hydrolase involved in NAD metabolism